MAERRWEADLLKRGYREIGDRRGTGAGEMMQTNTSSGAEIDPCAKLLGLCCHAEDGGAKWQTGTASNCILGTEQRG